MTAVRLDRQGRSGAQNKILTHSYSREQSKYADSDSARWCWVSNIYYCWSGAPQALQTPISSRTDFTHQYSPDSVNCQRCTLPGSKADKLQGFTIPDVGWHQTGSILQPNRLTLHNIMKEADLKAAMQQLQSAICAQVIVSFVHWVMWVSVTVVLFSPVRMNHWWHHRSMATKSL